MGGRGRKEGRLSETDTAVGRTNSRPTALSPEPGNPASQRGRREGQEHRAGKQGGPRRGERRCLELTWGKRSQRGTRGVRGKQGQSGGVVSVWRQNNMQPTETGVSAEQTARCHGDPRRTCHCWWKRTGKGWQRRTKETEKMNSSDSGRKVMKQMYDSR